MDGKREIKRCIIITGMSGAGKSSALNVFEDQGFYAIDNLPPALLPQLMDVLANHPAAVNYGVAAVVDARGKELLNDLSCVVEKLREKGVPVGRHRARRVSRGEYGSWDHIVYMDAENAWGLSRILGSDPEGKVSRLLDWTDRPRDVADPWYTGDFESTYRDVLAGCEALLAKL